MASRTERIATAPGARYNVPKLPYHSLKPYQARHLLAVNDPIPWAELETLALAKFRAPRWVATPPGFTSTRIPAARRAEKSEAPTLRLTRHTTISGPYLDSDGWSQQVVYDVICPRERWEDPPLVGIGESVGDPDGLIRAFPDGLPNAEEERVFAWLLALASRLGGSVKCDLGNAGLPLNYVEVILTPSPVRNVGRTIYSTRDLPAGQVLGLVERIVPQARLATEGTDWLGPTPELRRSGNRFAGDLDEFELADLHDAADEFDLAALRAGVNLDGYGIIADLGREGYLAVEVAPEDVLPQAVENVARTRGQKAQWLAYRVNWYPEDFVEANWEFPKTAFLASAARVRADANAIAAALTDAVGGILLDQNDLPLNPAKLAEVAAVVGPLPPVGGCYDPATSADGLSGCQPD